jgi:hypothetical protein
MTIRTTVRLPEELLTRAKRKAAAEGRTLTALIEEGLRLAVSAKPEPRSSAHNDPPVSSAGGGLQPGLRWEDLANQAQELDDLESFGSPKRRR